MTKKGLIYFASDMHLGMYPEKDSRRRERIIVDWLNSVQENMSQLWLLGDIFDYWFEYKHVIPRGFSRFIGKLAELSDNGVKIHILAGNHDVWYFDYFPSEIGATIHHRPVITTLGKHTFYLSHGDGLTPGDRGYKLIKSMFTSKFLQWCYARIHPNGATGFAKRWSKKSRYSKAIFFPFKGEGNEEQIQFAKKYLLDQPDIDLFLFGHRHMPYDVKVIGEKRAICLGDWIGNFSYGIYDGKDFKLHFWDAKNDQELYEQLSKPGK